MKVRNDREAKESRVRKAKEGQEARTKRTDEEQLRRLDRFGYIAKKERERLKRKIRRRKRV